MIDIASTEIFESGYIYNSSKYLSLGVTNWGTSGQYYNQPTAGFTAPLLNIPSTLNGMKLTNHDAYNETTSPNGNSLVVSTHNFINNTISTSKQDGI